MWKFIFKVASVLITVVGLLNVVDCNHTTLCDFMRVIRKVLGAPCPAAPTQPAAPAAVSGVTTAIPEPTATQPPTQVSTVVPPSPTATPAAPTYLVPSRMPRSPIIRNGPSPAVTSGTSEIKAEVFGQHIYMSAPQPVDQAIRAVEHDGQVEVVISQRSTPFYVTYPDEVEQGGNAPLILNSDGSEGSH